jgi:hypothetical protein
MEGANHSWRRWNSTEHSGHLGSESFLVAMASAALAQLVHKTCRHFTITHSNSSRCGVFLNETQLSHRRHSSSSSSVPCGTGSAVVCVRCDDDSERAASDGAEGCISRVANVLNTVFSFDIMGSMRRSSGRKMKYDAIHSQSLPLLSFYLGLSNTAVVVKSTITAAVQHEGAVVVGALVSATATPLEKTDPCLWPKQKVASTDRQFGGERARWGTTISSNHAICSEGVLNVYCNVTRAS